LDQESFALAGTLEAQIAAAFLISGGTAISDFDFRIALLRVELLVFLRVSVALWLTVQLML